jgi:glycosyltransferase involved in cell wall biosynthesis
MIAFHFPPMAGSSGIQRTLRFVQHLPEFGWEPLVLTAHRQAYERVAADLERELPERLIVRRALAWDTARHLAIAGRYPGFLARPDRWMTWRFHGIRLGLAMINEFKPAAIWSTYPIATAHRIGATLARRSRLPWIADFRDPMAQPGYPADPKTYASFEEIESETLTGAAVSVFTTPGAAAEYRRRYPGASVAVIENGYDEATFTSVEPRARSLGPLINGAVTVLHSGIIYPSERDPTQLFSALAALKQRGTFAKTRLVVRFRAPVHEALLRALAERYEVSDCIELAEPIPYRDALLEMLRADGLLLIQAANCNEQIPAKLYEYLRARRPLLVLTDPAGDTAQAARTAGVERIARLDDAAQITELLEAFLSDQSLGKRLTAKPRAIEAASRLARAKQLAQLLDEATDLGAKSGR